MLANVFSTMAQVEKSYVMTNVCFVARIHEIKDKGGALSITGA